MVKSRLARPATVFVLSPTRQGNQRHLGEFRVVPHAAGDFVAVQIGHAQVQEGDGRPANGKGFQCRLAVVTNVDIGAKVSQQHAQTVGSVFVVVGDQDALHARDGGTRSV